METVIAMDPEDDIPMVQGEEVPRFTAITIDSSSRKLPRNIRKSEGYMDSVGSRVDALPTRNSRDAILSLYRSKYGESLEREKRREVWIPPDRDTEHDGVSIVRDRVDRPDDDSFDHMLSSYQRGKGLQRELLQAEGAIPRDDIPTEEPVMEGPTAPSPATQSNDGDQGFLSGISMSTSTSSGQSGGMSIPGIKTSLGGSHTSGGLDVPVSTTITSTGDLGTPGVSGVSTPSASAPVTTPTGPKRNMGPGGRLSGIGDRMKVPERMKGGQLGRGIKVGRPDLHLKVPSSTSIYEIENLRFRIKPPISLFPVFFLAGRTKNVIVKVPLAIVDIFFFLVKLLPPYWLIWIGIHLFAFKDKRTLKVQRKARLEELRLEAIEKREAGLLPPLKEDPEFTPRTPSDVKARPKKEKKVKKEGSGKLGLKRAKLSLPSRKKKVATVDKTGTPKEDGKKDKVEPTKEAEEVKTTPEVDPKVEEKSGATPTEDPVDQSKDDLPTPDTEVTIPEEDVVEPIEEEEDIADDEPELSEEPKLPGESEETKEIPVDEVPEPEVATEEPAVEVMTQKGSTKKTTSAKSSAGTRSGKAKSKALRKKPKKTPPKV